MRQRSLITVEVDLVYDDEHATEFDAQQLFLDSLGNVDYARIIGGLVDVDGSPHPEMLDRTRP